MATTDISKKTHQCVLPQRAALESSSADTVGVTTKRGEEVTVTGNGARTTDVDHGRGETGCGDRRRIRRHGRTASVVGSVTGGGDPTTTASPKTEHPQVLVLDRHGKPLMPCHPARARQLLANGRARVANLEPFTIRLIDRTVSDSVVDGVLVKIDPGSTATGISVATVDSHGTLRSAAAIEVRHRGRQISAKLTARAGLRRGRRSRNLRYRAPRTAVPGNAGCGTAGPAATRHER